MNQIRQIDKYKEKTFEDINQMVKMVMNTEKPDNYKLFYSILNDVILNIE